MRRYRFRGWLAALLGAAARRDFAGMTAIDAPGTREMLAGMPAIVGRDSIEAFLRALQAQHPRVVAVNQDFLRVDLARLAELVRDRILKLAA